MNKYMQNAICIKKGDTLSIIGSQVKLRDLDNGELTDLSTWTARSTVTKDGFSDELIVTILPSSKPNYFGLKLYADSVQTAEYPLGILDVDIRFESPEGVIVTSPTFRLNIIQNITL